MKFLGKHINRFKTIFDNTVIFKEVSSGISSDDNMLIIKTNGTLVQRPITDITAELALTGYSFDGTNIVINNTEAGGSVVFQTTSDLESNEEYFKINGSEVNITVSKDMHFTDNVKAKFGSGSDLQIHHDASDSFITNSTGHLTIDNGATDKNIIFKGTDTQSSVATDITALTLDMSEQGKALFNAGATFENAINIETGGPKLILKDTTDDDDQQINFVNNSGVTDYMIRTSDPTGGGGGDGFYIGSVQSDGEVALFTNNTTALTLDTSQNALIAGNLTVNTPSTSSGIYAQFVNLKGFCTLTTNYQFTEDVEDTKSPFEIALDYGSATISSSTEVTQSKLFRSAGFHVPVACNLNAINMQVTCNAGSGNITVAIVEYVPSELAADTNDHPRTIFEEVVVASSANNNKVKTVAVAVGDINNTTVAAGSHIMIMVKGDSSAVSAGGKAFVSAAIEIKW